MCPSPRPGSLPSLLRKFTHKGCNISLTFLLHRNSDCCTGYLHHARGCASDESVQCPQISLLLLPLILTTPMYHLWSNHIQLTQYGSDMSTDCRGRQVCTQQMAVLLEKKSIANSTLHV